MCLGKQQVLDRLAKYEAARRADASEVRSRLDRIEVLLARMTRVVSVDAAMDAASLRNKEEMMADLSQIRSEVEENSDVTSSAVALLNDLSARLSEIADDPEEVRALAEQLSSQTDALAAAVAANTPAAPEGPTEPTEPTPGEGETPVEPEPIG